MARIRQFVDNDVLTEARLRIHHVMDTFDGWVVAFSGGKDSLVTLDLVRSVQAERGDTRKVRAVFRDEELIPDGVVEFVTRMRDEPWLDLEWWAVPQESQKFILGQNLPLTMFDPDREWVRQPPPWALNAEDIGMAPGEVLGQNTGGDEMTVRNVKGKVAIFTGVRAAESMMRYRSCVNKLHENYIVASSCRRAQLVRPVFDWSEDDIFRYFYDTGVPYCAVYDLQAWAGERMRVSTPLHAEASKRLSALRVHAPELYEGLMRVFPEVQVQERYFHELDSDALVFRYAESWDTIQGWIDANVEDPHWHAKASAELAAVKTRAGRVPESYPLVHVLRAIMGSGGKRTVQPMRPDDGRKLIETWERKLSETGPS